jgi:hypothetical protein
MIKMWLQNHEKTNIETIKKLGLQTIVFHGNYQQKPLFNEVPIKTGPCQLSSKPEYPLFTGKL